MRSTSEVEKKFPSSFATRLRDRRRTLRLGLKAVACDAGLSISYLQQMEAGSKPAPPQAVVERLAIALRLSDGDAIQLARAAESARRRAHLELSGVSDQAVEVVEKLLATLDTLTDNQLEILSLVLEPSREVQAMTR